MAKSMSPSLSKSAEAMPRPAIGTEKSGPRCLRDFFENSLAEIAEHEQRFFVGDFAVIEMNVVHHCAVELNDVRPAVVIIIDKFHGDAAEEDGFVANAELKVASVKVPSLLL